MGLSSKRVSYSTAFAIITFFVMIQGLQETTAKPFDSGGQDELEEDISQSNLRDFLPRYDLEDLVITDKNDWKPSPGLSPGHVQKRIPLDVVSTEAKPYQYAPVESPDSQNSRIRQKLLSLRNQYGDKRMAFGPYAYRKRQILYRQCFFNPISCF